MIVDTIAALRELNEHPDTVFTVISGEGRFFSAGADGSDHRFHVVQHVNEAFVEAEVAQASA